MPVQTKGLELQVHPTVAHAYQQAIAADAEDLLVGTGDLGTERAR
ncbi:MAG: hypothetical protein VX416_11200 [Pseudomonadota bacterium]|nr:hypothetical protein [Pseudomonadota bacterium]